jgi:hypothetical protein
MEIEPRHKQRLARFIQIQKTRLPRETSGVQINAGSDPGLPENRWPTPEFR